MGLSSGIFNKNVALNVGQNQLSAILLANGYDGTFNLSQLKISDLVGDSVVILTNTPTTPGGTTGETVGATGVSKQFHLDGNRKPIDATCVWIYQASAHAVTINVIGY